MGDVIVIEDEQPAPPRARRRRAAAAQPIVIEDDSDEGDNSHHESPPAKRKPRRSSKQVEDDSDAEMQPKGKRQKKPKAPKQTPEKRTNAAGATVRFAAQPSQAIYQRIQLALPGEQMASGSRDMHGMCPCSMLSMATAASPFRLLSRCVVKQCSPYLPSSASSKCSVMRPAAATIGIMGHCRRGLDRAAEMECTGPAVSYAKGLPQPGASPQVQAIVCS